MNKFAAENLFSEHKDAEIICGGSISQNLLFEIKSLKNSLFSFFNVGINKVEIKYCISMI